MQILTVRQVEFCCLIIKQSVPTTCVPGVSFQNKLLVADRTFNYEDRQQAKHYCETMYLASKGSKLYLLLDEADRLTVWREES